MSRKRKNEKRAYKFLVLAIVVLAPIAYLHFAGTLPELPELPPIEPPYLEPPFLYVDNFVKYPNNPVLEGTIGAWDGYGIRDPTLLVDSSGHAAKVDGKYVMYYSGTNNLVYATGRATSTDGVNWVKDPNNPVLTEGSYAFQGSVIKRGSNDYIMYYFPGTTLGFKYATSSDSITWNKNPNYILKPSDFGIYRMGLPYVTKTDKGWYMVFEGGRQGENWFIFGAVSSDGYNWTPLNNGQKIYTSISYWDRTAQANPSIYQIASGRYVILYNGACNHPDDWDIGILYSTDLVSWTSWINNPIITRGSYGEWDDTRIEGARILMDDVDKLTLRLWYFGLPTLDSIGGGKIGYATCTRSTNQSAVGGIVIPVDKLEVLAQYIILVSMVVLVVLATGSLKKLSRYFSIEVKVV